MVRLAQQEEFAMRDARHPERSARRGVARLTTILLLVSLAAFALPTAAVAVAPPAQGVQFGDPIDLNVFDANTQTCKRNTEVNRLLYNDAMLRRTSWIRRKHPGLEDSSRSVAR
jgi:hypothetical protein